LGLSVSSCRRLNASMLFLPFSLHLLILSSNFVGLLLCIKSFLKGLIYDISALMSPLKTSDAFIRLMIYGFTLGLCDTSLIPGST
jgi:hypothetical protein